jgi:Skp family chaperone for outer membrane proteins
MTKNLFDRLGWAVAFGLLAVLVLVGFQGATEKSGAIDMNRVLQESALGAQHTRRLNDELRLRRELLDFVNTYRVLTMEQAQRIRELTLKANATEQERSELQRIRQDVIASDRRRNEISQRSTLTEADRALLQDFANRAQTMAATMERWNDEFSRELSELEQNLSNEAVARARAALSQVARAQGFTIVFESRLAPYAANDLTDATIRAMNETR